MDFKVLIADGALADLKEIVESRRQGRSHIRLGRRDALQEFEFVPPRVEVRDFVARRF